MKLRDIMKDWHTPNTYNSNYKTVPNKSGVYALICCNFYTNNKKMKLLYVGSSINLNQRYSKPHKVISKLRDEYDYVGFYFKQESEYRILEKSLIKKLQPKYNKQWR